MGAMKNAYKILIGKPLAKIADKRIGNTLLKHILRVMGMEWTELS
jgi:hypothetical protein